MKEVIDAFGNNTITYIEKKSIVEVGADPDDSAETRPLAGPAGQAACQCRCRKPNLLELQVTRHEFGLN